jgi:hypothetical protein
MLDDDTKDLLLVHLKLGVRDQSRHTAFADANTLLEQVLPCLDHTVCGATES